MKQNKTSETEVRENLIQIYKEYIDVMDKAISFGEDYAGIGILLSQMLTDAVYKLDFIGLGELNREDAEEIYRQLKSKRQQEDSA